MHRINGFLMNYEFFLNFILIRIIYIVIYIYDSFFLDKKIHNFFIKDVQRCEDKFTM